MFIVLEGTDGSGKSEQAKRLQAHLRKKNIDCLLTHEPQRDSPIGKLIYEYLHTEPPHPRSFALLYAADRSEHVEKVINPALATGQIVISDRYYPSSLAYHGVDMPMEEIWDINKNFPRPDITFLLVANPKKLLPRMTRERDQFETLNFQQKVFLNYRKIRNHFGLSMIEIDAAADPVTIHRSIVKTIEQRYPDLYS